MATYYHSSGGGTNNSGNNDWWSWMPIIILFCIPSPFTWVVAFFLLVSKLKGGSKKKDVKRHPYDLQRDWEQVSWDEQGKKTAGTAQSGQKVYSSASAKQASKVVRDSGKKNTSAKEQ